MSKFKPLSGAVTPPEQDPQKRKQANPAQRPGGTRPQRIPPDSIPDLMPGVDPQQTPGVDRPPAEHE